MQIVAGHEPEFRVGDIVQLNSGGPSMLVVDIFPWTVTAAWNDGKDEYEFKRSCIHRVRDLW